MIFKSNIALEAILQQQKEIWFGVCQSYNQISRIH